MVLDCQITMHNIDSNIVRKIIIASFFEPLNDVQRPCSLSGISIFICSILEDVFNDTEVCTLVNNH